MDTVLSGMPHVGTYIRAWRISQQCSERALAERAGMTEAALEAVEAEETDPTGATLQALATALKIPTPWLFVHPKDIDLVCKDDDDASPAPAHLTAADPVVERILQAVSLDRSLYVLLTALLQSGEPKLLRAAEVNLRSLVKQSKQATVPWQTRPPGHFEPPSD